MSIEAVVVAMLEHLWLTNECFQPLKMAVSHLT
jgi:hypothetical protein